MKESLRLLKPFLRGLPIVVLAMVLCGIAARKYLSYVTPMYESTAKLRLADIGEGIPNANLFKDLDVFATSNKIAAEIEVMKSRELLLQTLAKLDFATEVYRVGDIRTVELYHESPLTILLEKGTEQLYDKRFSLVMNSFETFEIRSKDGQTFQNGSLGMPFQLMGSTVLVQLNDSLLKSRRNVKVIDRYEFEFLSQEKQLDIINKNLDIISVDKDVPVIRLNYKSNNPEKASRFVNMLAETYIYDYIDNKYDAARTTVTFLDKQIEEAGNKLAKAENSIEDYRNRKHITNIRQETETDLRQISQMKIQLSNMKANLEAIELLNAYVAQGKDRFLELAPNFEAFTDLLSTEIIKNIKKLQADKRDLLLTYTSNDEKVQVIDQKIKDLTSYLVESIKNTRNNLQIKYSELSRDIETAEKVFEQVPEKEKNMAILTREFDLMQSSYNFLNEKRIEAEIAQSARIAFHRVISPAVPAQKPVSPNKSIITIVFVILGMLGAIAAIYAVHFTKAKVNDQYSIEQNSGIPVAVSTPFVKEDLKTVFVRNVIQLELKGLIKKGEILNFTSFHEQEGRCFNVLNICQVLTSQGRRVLLLDVQGNLAQLRTEPLGEANSWATVLDGLTYMDSSSIDRGLSSPEPLRELINRLKADTDVVIINNELLSRESRALLMMRLSDHNLMVVDARRTALSAIAKMELLKQEYLVPDLWFLLNKANYNPNVLSDVARWLKKSINRKV